jgi:pimeloyl-ACP methyl ester carboxylesterase
MVFDSADNPDDPAGTRQERIDEQLEELAPLEAGLEAALEACYDPRDCPIYNGGDPVGYFKQAATKLELVNRAANNHPLAGALGVITTLYFEVGRPDLWHGLFELNENDDPARLLEFAMAQIGEPGAASFTGHVNCLDGWVLSPVARKTLLEESEILAAIIQEQFPLLASMPTVAPEECPFYDQFAPDPFEGPLDGGGVPILVIGNPADPITSFGESEELAAEALSNGYLVEVSHAEHVVYPANQCVNEHVHRALIDGVYPSERRVICEEVELQLAKELLPWTECAPNLECLRVPVPADYRDPEARAIDIFIDVHWATSPEQRIGYLFVNPGGPGVSGVQYVASTEYGIFPDEIVERFDIIGFDPRGVGFSDPEFACGDPGEQIALLSTIDENSDTPEEMAAGEAAANLCIQSMGPVGGRLHTGYVARDMDEIRQALGAEQISYYGAGYGSGLGSWYASLFPESVRAMVVDAASNAVDSTATQDERIMQQVEAVSALAVGLEAALIACDDPVECPIYNDGDPIGYFRQAAAKLHLVNAAVNNYPRAAHHGVNSTLRNEESWPDLWQGLFELNENDDPSILLKYARQRTSVQYLGANPPIHVNCLDSWVTDPEGQLDRYTRRLDRANRNADRAPQQDDANDGIGANATVAEILELIDIPIPDVCPFYHQFAPEPVEGPYDGGGLPILVVGNHDDTATPFSESEEIATEVLSNGYLVETSHRKHVVYPENQCVNDHIHRALIDGELPSARRVFCEEDRTFAPAASAASVLALLLGVGIAFLIGLGVFIWWLVRKISQGQAGPNRHGPDPRASDPTAQEELP